MTALLLLATLFGCSAEDPAPAQAPVPRVSVATAQPAPERFERELTGLLEARRDTTLAARAGGTVVARLAEPGTRVDEGDAILRFDSREASAAVGTARAGVTDSEAQLQDAQQRWERLDSLGDLASEQDRTAARSAFHRAEAAVERARAQLQLAEVQRSYLTVRAPFAGEVAMLDPEVGETVAPGSPVARVVDTDGLEVTIGLLGDEVRSARDPNTRFEVRSGTTTVPATVDHVSPAADPQTLTWTVDLSVDPSPALIPGMPVTVLAGLASGGVGVEVPVQALRGDDQMWVVEGGVVRAATVRVLRETSATLVVDGVEAGSAVVIRGPASLRDGDPVQVIGGGEG